jgi:hypothetical protein
MKNGKSYTKLEYKYKKIPLTILYLGSVSPDESRVFSYLDELYEKYDAELNTGDDHLILAGNRTADVSINYREKGTDLRKERLIFKGVDLTQKFDKESMTRISERLENDRESSEYLRKLIEKSDLDDSTKEELKFHLTDIYPDLNRLVQGTINEDLTMDELAGILFHAPNHIIPPYDILFGPWVNPFEEE